MSADGSASPNKTGVDSGTATPLPTFTEKEERVLKVAWFCLKSGAPEIDYEKLTKAGGFNTQKVSQTTLHSPRECHVF
jgi:hypothetical protein